MLHHHCFPYYADKKIKAHRSGVLLRITPLMAELGWEPGIFCLPPAERFPGALLWRRCWPSRCSPGGSTQLCLCLELTLPHPAPHQYTDTALGAGVTLLTGPGRAGHWGGISVGWRQKALSSSRSLGCNGSVFVGLLAGVWVAHGVELTDTELPPSPGVWSGSLGSVTQPPATGIYQPQASRKCQLRATEEMQEDFWEEKQWRELRLCHLKIEALGH